MTNEELKEMISLYDEIEELQNKLERLLKLYHSVIKFYRE